MYPLARNNSLLMMYNSLKTILKHCTIFTYENRILLIQYVKQPLEILFLRIRLIQ